ncbi:ECF transporter S component [Chloroflexota bacterium]
MALILSTNTIRNKILLCLSAAVLLGVLNWACSGFLLPGAPVVSLRPQIAIPIIIGLVLGPVPGFVTGFLGNVLGDLIAGYGLMYFDWSIGNGLIGAVPGLLYLRGIREIRTVSQFGLMQVTIVGGNLLGLATGSLFDSLILHRATLEEAVLSWFLPALLTNVLIALALVPVILLVLRRMAITVETRTMLFISLLLVVSILINTSVLISRANDTLISVIHAEAGMEALTTNNEQIISSATLNLLRWAGLVAVFVLLAGMFISVFLVKRITSPVSLLCMAAKRVEEGEYKTEFIDPVVQRSDELGQLAKIFQDMTYKIYTREQVLKQQINELKIEVDKTKAEKQVAEITDTDYFRQLQQKSRELRERKRGKESL